MERIPFVPHHRIPSNAVCVFSGIRSELYQWDQVMYDGTSSTFEMIRFLDGAFTIAITADHRILLTEQEQPGKDAVFIGLPG